MPPNRDLAFLLDVDNTLFDNDRFAADLGDYLDRSFGTVQRERYWSIYAELRDALGYADYLGSVQRFRVGLEDHEAMLGMSAYLLDYPFAEHLYPQALEVLAHLATMAPTWILSDGDMVFQPRKIQRSGIAAAVGGRVIIDVHKELALAALEMRVPVARYVMIDDKANLLAAMKRQLGDRLSTVFVHQGHYAAAFDAHPADPAPDVTIAVIGDLLKMGPHDFPVAAARPQTATSRA